MRGGGVKKEPTASQIGLYQGFLKEIRKKVHRLLYHSLCTHVAAGEGFEPSHTESESAVLPLHNPAKSKNHYTFFYRFVKSKFQDPAHFFDIAVSMLPPNTTKRSYRNSIAKFSSMETTSTTYSFQPIPVSQSPPQVDSGVNTR